uniref:C2H2-type domain-containing protein n=1 Tax=Macrostomum lignano TaxID=282301 RepID=A0A1I8GNN4_9PLAT
ESPRQSPVAASHVQPSQAPWPRVASRRISGSPGRVGNWTAAKLLAVHEDTKSVLVHYHKWSAKFDEEIEMSSERLRPLNKPTKQSAESAEAAAFQPGDLVLARWRDTLWYQAKVISVDSKGHYSLFFTLDSWKAKGYRASQLKPYDAAEAEAIFAAQWPATGPSEINYDPMVRRIQENSRRRRLEKRGGGVGGGGGGAPQSPPPPSPTPPQEAPEPKQGRLPPLKMTLKIPTNLLLKEEKEAEEAAAAAAIKPEEQQSEYSLTFEECQEDASVSPKQLPDQLSRKRPADSPPAELPASEEASTLPKPSAVEPEHEPLAKRARLDPELEQNSFSSDQNVVAEAGSSAATTAMTTAMMSAEETVESAADASAELLPPPPPPPPQQQGSQHEQRLPKMRVRLPKLSTPSLDRSASVCSPAAPTSAAAVAAAATATSTPGSSAWTADRRRSFFGSGGLGRSNSSATSVGSGSGKRKTSTEPTVPAHWTIETFECDQCGKSFRKEKLLSDHIRFYHRPKGSGRAASSSKAAAAGDNASSSRRSEAATAEDLESLMSSSRDQHDSELASQPATVSKAHHKSSSSSLQSSAAAATAAAAAAAAEASIVAPDKRRVVHCQCGRSGEDDMIQCEVCRAFQHARCASKAVDLRSIPDLYYVCSFCLHPRKEFKSTRRVWHHKWLRQPSSGAQTSPMMDVVRQVMELYAIVQKLKRFNTDIHSRLIKLAPDLAEKSPDEIRQLLQLHSQRQQQQQQQQQVASSAASTSAAAASASGGAVSGRTRLDSVGELADFLPSLELDQLESLLGGSGAGGAGGNGGGEVGEADEIGGVLSLPPPPPVPPPVPPPPPGADANELTALLCTQQALGHVLSIVAAKMSELRERPSVRPLAERTPRTLRPRLPALRNNLAKLRRLAALPKKN